MWVKLKGRLPYKWQQFLTLWLETQLAQWTWVVFTFTYFFLTQSNKNNKHNIMCLMKCMVYYRDVWQIHKIQWRYFGIESAFGSNWLIRFRRFIICSFCLTRLIKRDYKAIYNDLTWTFVSNECDYIIMVLPCSSVLWLRKDQVIHCPQQLEAKKILIDKNRVI